MTVGLGHLQGSKKPLRRIFDAFWERNSGLARSDKALLAVFLLAAVLGTWTRCLLMNDGAVFMSAGWLGDAWHLYFDQIAGRAVSVLTLFGPAWAARTILGLGASAYMAVAHARSTMPATLRIGCS